MIFFFFFVIKTYSISLIRISRIQVVSMKMQKSAFTNTWATPLTCLLINSTLVFTTDKIISTVSDNIT